MDEQSEEGKNKLIEKQAELTKILDAFDSLDKTKEWKVLRELLFSPSLEAIERQMRNEVLSPEINTDKLYRLQGEWAWAKQYTDIPGFIKTIQQQLLGIKKNIQ